MILWCQERLTAIFERLPQVFFDEKPDDDNDYIRILGRMDNARVLKYVRRDYIREVRNLDDYKVFMASANSVFGEGKYVATKFVRALLGGMKSTHHLTPETWKFVPQQDFSDQSDIDWSLSIDEINSLLYDKYHLSEKERAFVDEKVQAMNVMG